MPSQYLCEHGGIRVQIDVCEHGEPQPRTLKHSRVITVGSLAVIVSSDTELDRQLEPSTDDPTIFGPYKATDHTAPGLWNSGVGLLEDD